jgi:phosphoribosylanthranilate isomerase
MANVKVKICGITNWRDARLAFAEGANFLGFNFYEASPRYITPARARRIVRRLPKSVEAVGIFVNEDEARLVEIARKVGLHYAQLHGEETVAAAERLQKALPVIRAVRVNGKFTPSKLAQHKRAAAVLLDAFDPKLHGGTGKAFNWAIARRCNSQARIFLAGGLTPENIAAAIRAAKPYAVDICSGVESKPGKKDVKKVKKLMREIRATPAGKRKR